MGKYVVTTVQTFVNRYYVEVEDPTWAHDGIVMGDLDFFSCTPGSEDIVDTRAVDQFPKAENSHDVNGATMKFDNSTDKWTTEVRWDLA